MTSKNGLLLTLAILSMLCGCGGPSSESNGTVQALADVNWQPVSTTSWEIGNASEENIDTEGLDTAYNLASKSNTLKSLLVIRNEKLIAEGYFGGTNANTLLHERSVTKTIIAMLIGKAIEDGYLIGIEQTMGPFFESEYPDLSNSKRQITLENLLTMTSGFEWDEGQPNTFNDWVSSADVQAHILDRELIDTPGTKFNYNSATSHLLSVIISKATGMSTLEYANESLFNPLGITQKRWETLSDSFINGGAGLELRAIDLAQIGLMLLNDGIWQDTQVIPSDWVRSAKTHQLNFDPDFGLISVDGYGYLMWLAKGSNQDIFLAWGWGGQFIILVPGKNMLVIMNSDWQVNSDTADAQYATALDILVNHIIPAAN